MSSRTGIRLPQSLLEQIGDDREGPSHPRGRFDRPRVSRKEARKQVRSQKKERKASFYSSHSNTPKRAADAEHPDSPTHKKAKLAAPETSTATRSSLSASIKAEASSSSLRTSQKSSKIKKSAGKQKTALERLSRRDEPATLPRTLQERNEEKYIAYLESMLGSGAKSKNGGAYDKELEDDGLGDLLMDLDSIGTPASNNPAPFEDRSSETRSDVDDSLSQEDEEEVDGPQDSWEGFGDDDGESARDGGDRKNSPPEPSSKAVPGTRYIPPHLRNKPVDDAESEKTAKLSRQLKGLLNRLSEQNIAGILSDIEELYRQHRRHDVTSSITSLIINGISTHSILLDSYVVLHAAFVSSLHKIVGVEFAAYFLQNVVSTYEQHFSSLSVSDEPSLADVQTRGKECSNLIVLLSELYNFQVISCVLIYDVIRSLLSEDLTEFSVELLLKLLRNSGQQLRQDDSSALKDIIQIVQNKISGSEEPSSSRTRFMIETLVNLKNNKTRRTATRHAGGDAVDRMKKFLSGLSKKRQVAANDPLRVSLADLHSAESKGKWWLVGAAWGGDLLMDRQDGANKIAVTSADDAVENVLLKLAKKQGMNTNIRRSIFVVLMSSDDYVDACERLAQLNLSEVQQREVVRVLLHCCGNEKSYNPYYAFVCQRLCQTSHSYKVTLQFCLWDFLRDLGETNVGGAEIIKNLKDDDASGFDVKTISPTRLRNVATAYAWWVAKDSVTLAIFKPVDFTSLKVQTRKFIIEFHRQLFLSSQSSTPVLKDLPLTRNQSALEEIFIKATSLATLAAGLVYFLSSTFKRKGEEDADAAFMSWAAGVVIETLRTGVDVIPTL